MKGSQLLYDQSEWEFKKHGKKTSVLSNLSKNCHLKKAYLILWRTEKNWAHLYLIRCFLKVENNLEAKK